VWVQGLETPKRRATIRRGAPKSEIVLCLIHKNCMRPWFPWNRPLKAVHSSTRCDCGSCQCLKETAVTYLLPNNMAQTPLPQIFWRVT
jgi:hypothetical protein